MDALKLLKADHDEVKKMLSDLESTTERAEKTRTEGLATLKTEPSCARRSRKRSSTRP